MSRPFSYNDENFTVIGNLLICHIKLTKDIPVGDNIVELPSEIYKRLLYTTNNMIRVRNLLNNKDVYFCPIGIRYDNGKYYLFTDVALNSKTYKYVCVYYCLKNI